MASRTTKVHLSDGDVILFTGGIAVVRYFGKVKFGRGDWVGLELSGPMGDCDGSKSGVRYFKCNRNHGRFIRLSDVKRKITAEELLLKLNSEVEKAPKGKLSMKEKKELERQIQELANALSKQRQANQNLEKELSRTREENNTLVEQAQLGSGDWHKSSDISSRKKLSLSGPCGPLEKSIHMCFGYCSELLRDLKPLIETHSFQNRELELRVDDRLHLMLMELIQTHHQLEELGLVTKVDASAPIDRKDVFEPIIVNKTRPPISTLFSNFG